MNEHVPVQAARIACYHCGLPAQPAFAAEINGELQDFCCVGCAAVAGFIQQSGLGNFYQYRDQLPLVAANQEIQDLDIYDDLDYQQGFVEVLPEKGLKRARIQIEGMNCSACAWLVEKRLLRQEFLATARVNYSQRLLFLEWSESSISLSQLLGQVQKLGFKIKPDRPQQRLQSQQKEGKELLLRLGIAGIGMMQVGMYAIASYMAGSDSGSLQSAAGMTEGTRDLLRVASLILATMVICYSAQPFFTGAWRALKNRHLSIDVPVALALGLAYSSSLVATWKGQGEVYFDAVCMFTFFLLVSRYLEFRARSRWALDRDRSSAGDQALLIEEDGGEAQQRVVGSHSLRAGQKILVRAGEILPVDAELLDEHAELDMAQLTGEFQPQIRHRGEELSSGSINLGNPVYFRVLRPQDQSAMARIESIVSQAEIHRPRIAGLADQLAGYFVAILISLALGTYGYWWFFNAEQAFWVALSVLVVGCPCALSLATPTALTVLMRHLREQGILVQRPEALEVLPNIDRILFDKTGTLTEGRYQMTDVQLAGTESEAECLRIASVLESFSNHPLAGVFDRPISEYSYAVSDWNAYSGRGVEAQINGQPYRIGTREFVAGLSASSLRIQLEDQSKQRIYLGTNVQWLAVFSVSDRLRPEAISALDALREKLPGVKLGLLSGDPSAEVGVLARKLGMHDWADTMTPEGKYQCLKHYQHQGEKVLSVGDGINDAPLLSAADASIALSNAVDLSKNKADFVLLSNSLEAIPLLVDNARRARKIIAENLGWALGYNLLAIPLAMMGMVPPWMAALGMSASSAIVVLNAFRARVRNKQGSHREKARVQTC